MLKNSSKFLRKITIAGLLMGSSTIHLLHAQAPSPLKYFEIISGDSVKLYFSGVYSFTSKECADVVRYCKMTGAGSFTGPFIDMTRDSIKQATGRYTEGVKNGYFEEFYPSGQLKSKGVYKNNKPDGDWVFFHENGLPERQLKFSDTDTLLVLQTSPKGDMLVSQGEGTFNGEIEGPRGGRSWIAKGKIEGGKRTGKWKSFFADTNPAIAVGREDFDHGKMTSGERPNVLKGMQKDYCCQSEIFLFLTPSCIALEQFRFNTCDELSRRVTKQARLKSKGIYDNVVLSCLYEKNYFKYGNYNSKLKIRFTVNEEGIPQDFRTLSGPSEALANRLAYVLRQRVRWTPAIRNKKASPQILFLNVEYVDTGSGFSYKYWLSTM